MSSFSPPDAGDSSAPFLKRVLGEIPVTAAVATVNFMVINVVLNRPLRLIFLLTCAMTAGILLAIRPGKRRIKLTASVAILACMAMVATQSGIRSWTLGESDDPDTLDIAGPRLGRIGDNPVLRASFVGADRPMEVERVAVIQFTGPGDIGNDAIAPTPCGGQPLDIYTLGNAQLFHRDGATSTYTIDQEFPPSDGPLTEKVFGQVERLTECSDVVYVDAHPGISVDAGSSTEFAIELDSELVFDKRYVVVPGEAPSSPTTEEILFGFQLPVPPPGASPADDDTSPPWINFIGIAGYAHTGDCVAAAMRIEPTTGTSRQLDTAHVRFQGRALEDWLCAVDELPVEGGDSALPAGR